MLKVETCLNSESDVWMGSFSGFAKEIEHLLSEGQDYDTPLFVRYNFQESTFVIPKDPTNVLMIATGTGVAPFVGIIKDKEYCLVNGEESVFKDLGLLFGCRNDKEDFLISRCLEISKAQHIINHLILAFSRMSVL
jgi:sulfite reductase alpha subunit-like flavoprotein